MPDGNQYDEAVSAGNAYQRAIDAHAAAKGAPYAGSASEKLIKETATRLSSAKQDFTSKYTLYFNSMAAAHQRAEPRSYFVNESQ